jgi:2-methylcitrate dehydratase PrpD
LKTGKYGRRKDLMENYTKRLAHFCSALDYETIPKRVVERVKWLIMDNLGIILGGTKFEFGKTIADYTKALGDRAEATVLGFGFQSSTRSAAFANGSLSEVLEMQDGYTKGGNHPSCSTISASLAMAEWLKKSGKDLITAVVSGYEVGNRVAETIHPTHLSRGFQPTGTAGTVGAAAAVAKLLALDDEQLFNALAIAGFILPISTGENHWGCYSIKPVHGGAAAKSGIEAALLAKQGLKGAPLEGDPKIGKGFCQIVSDEPPKFEKAVEGLGEKYTIEEVYIKPYASGRINHGPIDIAIDLKKKYGLKAEEIEGILIKTYEHAVRSTGSITSDTNSPVLQCQLSMSYAVAAALMDGEMGLRQLTQEKTKNPKIHALGSKMRVVADQELQRMYPAHRPFIMEITMKGGEQVSGRVDYPKGDYRNPMTEEELKAKYFDSATGVIGKEKAEKAMDLLLDMENLESVDRLIGFLNQKP